MGSLSEHGLSVVMLPWLAHGHISPFLELAKRLSNHHMLVHLCSTPINLASVRDQLDAHAYPSVRLVELHLPEDCGLPPHHHCTKYLPSELMPNLKRAFDLAESAFGRLLDSLRPDLVVYDFLQPWAPTVAQRRGIPAVQFLTTAAASASTGYFMRCLMRPVEEFPFPAMRGIMQEDLERTPIVAAATGDGLSDGDRFVRCMQLSTGFLALRSFAEIESEYIDYYSFLTGKEMVPVGHLVPDDDKALMVADGRESEHSIMEWLNTKERYSVVFVSFGSEYFMSKEQMQEMAHGLELSGVSFIWVVRIPEESSSNNNSRVTAMPEEFTERVRVAGQGLVVERWAPQMRILAHPGIGGFVTHCGWSSVLEAMKLGVPMLFLPLQLDQPINARLALEKGVGIEVRGRTTGGGARRFTGEDVAKGIRNLLLGEEGDEARRKAQEMSEIIRNKCNQEIQILVEKMKALSLGERAKRNGTKLM